MTTIEVPLSEILDDWFYDNYGVEVLWNELELQTRRDDDTLWITIENEYDIKKLNWDGDRQNLLDELGV